MFPIADVVPARRTPWVTVTLLAVTAAAVGMEVALSLAAPGVLRDLAATFGAVPGDGTWYAPVTSLFLHTGWVSLIVNLIALWIFGGTLENWLGRTGFALLYVGAGAVARIIETLVVPGEPLPIAGAGGAIAAIGGAYLVLFPRSKVLMLVPLFVRLEIVEVPAAAVLGVWATFQFIGEGDWFGAAPDVANVALVGIAVGFAIGAVAGVAVRRLRPSVPLW